MCGETSPAFITWLGEVNLSEGGVLAEIPSRDWKPTICQRQGGGLREIWQKERRPISSPTYYDDGSLKCGSLQSRSRINNAPRFDIHQT